MWIVIVALIIYFVDNDYNAGQYIVTIGAGNNSATFGISITDDNIREQIEIFYLTIDGSSLPYSVTSRDRATVTIMDNDSKWFVINSYIYKSIL